MPEQKNLILAIVFSVLILVGFEYYSASKRPAPQPVAATEAPAAPTAPAQQAAENPAVPAAPTIQVDAARALPEPERRAHSLLQTSARVKVESPSLHGSIALTGGLIDDLTLAKHRETPDPKSAEIVLLSPSNAPHPYYASFGWLGGAGAAKGLALPGVDTPWKADRETLSPTTPVTLTWDNGQGLTFTRTLAIDADYMFTIADRVENTGASAVTLHPYGMLARTGKPHTEGMYILHEGPLGVMDGTLKEVTYSDLSEKKTVEMASNGGWLGITDKYWLAALVPPANEKLNGRFLHRQSGQTDKYQVDFLGDAHALAVGGKIEITHRLFAGAKEVDLLDRYGEQHAIPRFDLAIDFGWFYFLTKPFFYILRFLHAALGNFGLAILGLTVLVKLIFFPLANKSYQAMSKMKKLQPEMKKLQERFADDRQRMNQELMALYKREKVNPMAGCLPIIIQIPVFFALYKVLFVTIEMRHAPFYGWIHDLSAPDPTTWINFFGLPSLLGLPIWDKPFLGPVEFLNIGAWPLLMGVTMYLQQKLNPQPADPVQAKMFQFLPIVFTFLLGSFSAGLVIYWAWNNSLSILQQWVIMKRMGVSAT